jgi:hypothetical protein
MKTITIHRNGQSVTSTDMQNICAVTGLRDVQLIVQVQTLTIQKASAIKQSYGHIGSWREPVSVTQPGGSIILSEFVPDETAPGFIGSLINSLYSAGGSAMSYVKAIVNDQHAKQVVTRLQNAGYTVAICD